jgi:hypothetical protein
LTFCPVSFPLLSVFSSSAFLLLLQGLLVFILHIFTRTVSATRVLFSQFAALRSHSLYMCAEPMLRCPFSYSPCTNLDPAWLSSLRRLWAARYYFRFGTHSVKGTEIVCRCSCATAPSVLS